MGLHEWAYSNDYDPRRGRRWCTPRCLDVRFDADGTIEVEKGFTPSRRAPRWSAA
jgi:hypothetical protein